VEGFSFPAAVRLGNTWGVQFHPEKSSSPGLALIGRFLDGARSLKGSR
jgi:glutamine amidotransferase